MTEQYIGSRKVLGVTEVELKTQMGNSIIEVLFDSGDKKIMTQKTFDLVVTKEASDETTVADRKMDAVIVGCLAVMEEYDLDIMEWEKFSIRINTSLNENLNRATNYLWWKNDKSFVPGFDSLNNVSLLMVKNIINGIKNDNNK